MDLATAFALAVARRPDACAIIDGGEAHTYAQWHAESLRVAGGLARLGLAQGDRLLVLLKNRYEATVLYWVKRGWLVGEGGGRGRPRWFQLDPATVVRLKRIRAAHTGPRGRAE